MLSPLPPRRFIFLSSFPCALTHAHLARLSRFRCRSQGLLPPPSGLCTPATGILALAVQLIATIHLGDPHDLQRARHYLSAAGFDSDGDVIAVVDNEAAHHPHAAPIITADEAHSSGFFSPFVQGYAAQTLLPLPVIAYSHDMLAHAHSASSSSSSDEAVCNDMSVLNLSHAAAPVRAAHPERPDRLRAAGEEQSAQMPHDIPCCDGKFVFVPFDACLTLPSCCAGGDGPVASIQAIVHA